MKRGRMCLKLLLTLQTVYAFLGTHADDIGDEGAAGSPQSI